MQIDIYDTYMTASNGNIIHFDVLMKHGARKEIAVQHAREFLTSIGESADKLKSERCNFCHSDVVNKEIKTQIEKIGYYILQMEGCPTPYR